MALRPIAETGYAVSNLCFGTSGLGDMPDTYGYSVDEARAQDTLEAIFEGPVNFLDTSNNYGFGRSEARIGAAIRARGGLPEGFVLGTKLDRDIETGRFDAERARRSLEESMERLGLDFIPMLHLHDPEHARDLGEITGADGAIETLFAMKEEGLVGAVGLAMGRLEVMEPILAQFPFDALISHNRYTLLNRSANGMFDDAHARGIAIFNAAPFAGGVLAKGSAVMPRVTYQEADDAALAPVRQIEALCAEHGVAPGAVALQFSMRDPRISSTIVGVSKPERVAQTLDWAAADIPPDLWSALEAFDYESADPEARSRLQTGVNLAGRGAMTASEIYNLIVEQSDKTALFWNVYFGVGTFLVGILASGKLPVVDARIKTAFSGLLIIFAIGNFDAIRQTGAIRAALTDMLAATEGVSEALVATLAPPSASQYLLFHGAITVGVLAAIWLVNWPSKADAKD
ncbi:aldo/keto reductase [Roseobacteraceae bacterium S113]